MTDLGVENKVRWRTTAAQRIVVCLDLHNSMSDRRARDALPRSKKFLLHNHVLYECFEEWRRRPEGEQADIDLVDFVGDAGLVTFRWGSGEAALTFACDVVERLREQGCLTAVGVDAGEVALVDLADVGANVRARHAVGFPVDRAVRLSWIARPGEILSTGSVTSELSDSERFELSPAPEPVGVSLDKWPAEQLAVCGEVLVHSVRPRGASTSAPSTPPQNRIRIADYFRRLQLGALDFLNRAPQHRAAVAEGVRWSDRWRLREAIEDTIEFLTTARTIGADQIPELTNYRQATEDPVAAFCDILEETIAAMQKLLQRYHVADIGEVEEGDYWTRLERATNDLVVYSRAGLRRLERQS
jgi:hypothetical protein